MDTHFPDLLINRGKINQKDIMADSLYNEISFHSIELDDAEYNILKSLLYSNKLLKKAYKNRIIYRAFNIKIVKGHQQKTFFVLGFNNSIDFFTMLLKKVKKKNISEDLIENLEKILNSLK
jgi:ribonuclease HIII